MLFFQYIVEQIPSLAMPDVCTNVPVHGKAFCHDHCRILEAQTPPVPTDLRGFLKHCKGSKGDKHYNDYSEITKINIAIIHDIVHIDKL